MIFFGLGISEFIYYNDLSGMNRTIGIGSFSYNMIWALNPEKFGKDPGIAFL